MYHVVYNEAPASLYVEDLSYDLKIVNNSSFAVERVGLGYSGVESKAPSMNIELTLDPSSDY